MARAAKSDHSTNKPSVIQIILQEHQVLKDCIETLKDESASKPEKKKALTRFLHNLAIHAEAEEQSVYQPLSRMTDFHKKILEATEEHAVAKQLMSELTGLSDKRGLSEELEAKGKVLAEIVSHHLKEEERIMLPKMRQHFDREELQTMGEHFLRLSDAERENADSRIVSSIKRVSQAIAESY